MYETNIKRKNKKNKRITSIKCMIMNDLINEINKI